MGGTKYSHDVHPVNNLAEDHMLPIQEGRRHRGDEELRAIRVGSGILMRRGQRLVPARNCQKMEAHARTAMDSSPSRSCFSLKFSSANDFVP
jgi:hypothetical protein